MNKTTIISKRQLTVISKRFEPEAWDWTYFHCHFKTFSGITGWKENFRTSDGARKQEWLYHWPDMYICTTNQNHLNSFTIFSCFSQPKPPDPIVLRPEWPILAPNGPSAMVPPEKHFDDVIKMLKTNPRIEDRGQLEKVSGRAPAHVGQPTRKSGQPVLHTIGHAPSTHPITHSSRPLPIPHILHTPNAKSGNESEAICHISAYGFFFKDLEL